MFRVTGIFMFLMQCFSHKTNIHFNGNQSTKSVCDASKTHAQTCSTWKTESGIHCQLNEELWKLIKVESVPQRNIQICIYILICTSYVTGNPPA